MADYNLYYPDSGSGYQPVSAPGTYDTPDYGGGFIGSSGSSFDWTGFANNAVNNIGNILNGIGNLYNATNNGGAPQYGNPYGNYPANYGSAYPQQQPQTVFGGLSATTLVVLFILVILVAFVVYKLFKTA